MREGSLEAPTRHIVEWENPDFTDRAKTEAEMERVFDICHTCRRCFNLCDSFPRLFDLIDNSPTGELDAVPKADYKPVADACTLCDMCFMTKCPYVPPHEFNVDFPHLMLRYRAVEHKEGGAPFAERQLINTDRNGKLAAKVAPLANWASDRHNKLTRPMLEKIAGVDRAAALPEYHGRTFAIRAKSTPPPVNSAAPGAGRKAVLYATCFVNYNNPSIGEAARAVLAKNGVRNRYRLSAMLWHAAAGGRRPRFGRSARQDRFSGARRLDRSRLRRDRAHSVLRADDEVRVAADRTQ